MSSPSRLLGSALAIVALSAPLAGCGSEPPAPARTGTEVPCDLKNQTYRNCLTGPAGATETNAAVAPSLVPPSERQSQRKEVVGESPRPTETPAPRPNTQAPPPPRPGGGPAAPPPRPPPPPKR
jgi:hypothetical protein